MSDYIGEDDKNTVKILIIENEPDDMDCYSILLEQEYSVDVAHNINQAISKVENEKIRKYDLIILDVMMPVMDKYDIIESERGQITGLLFFDEYIDGKPSDIPVKVIILTAITAKMSDIIDKKTKNEDQIVKICRKSEVDAIDMREIVRNTIKHIKQ